MTDLGSAIRDLRLSAGQTRSQLATGAGIGQSELSRWERGYAVPNSEQIEKLGSALALSRAQIDFLQSTAGFISSENAGVDASVALAPEDKAIKELRVQISDVKSLLDSLFHSRDTPNASDAWPDKSPLKELETRKNRVFGGLAPRGQMMPTLPDVGGRLWSFPCYGTNDFG